MTQPTQKPRTKLTNADYMALTPPAGTGPRYQLINGELVKMSGAGYAHQTFLLQLGIQTSLQVDRLGSGEVLIAPFDVHIDLFNTYQPDLLYVSNERRQILDRAGANDAPDVVVEILSDSTRRRDLTEKLPVYAANGVREVWIVDLDARTLTVYLDDGSTFTPARVFTADDALVSEAMPGVTVELGPIFTRALGPAVS